jgi:hypothetical protein
MAFIVSKKDLKVSKTVDDLSLYPVTNWYHNPDLSKLQGVPEKYWKDDGSGKIVEMDAGEKAVVDTVLLDTAKTKAVMRLSLDCNDYVESKYKPAKQVYMVMLYCKALQDRDVTKQDEMKQFVTWMETVCGYDDAKVAEINACKTVKAVESVTWDFSQFD